MITYNIHILYIHIYRLYNKSVNIILNLKYIMYIKNLPVYPCT